MDGTTLTCDTFIFFWTLKDKCQEYHTFWFIYIFRLSNWLWWTPCVYKIRQKIRTMVKVTFNSISRVTPMFYWWGVLTDIPPASLENDVTVYTGPATGNTASIGIVYTLRHGKFWRGGWVSLYAQTTQHTTVSVWTVEGEHFTWFGYLHKLFEWGRGRDGTGRAPNKLSCQHWLWDTFILYIYIYVLTLIYITWSIQ